MYKQQLHINSSSAVSSSKTHKLKQKHLQQTSPLCVHHVALMGQNGETLLVSNFSTLVAETWVVLCVVWKETSPRVASKSPPLRSRPRTPCRWTIWAAAPEWTHAGGLWAERRQPATLSARCRRPFQSSPPARGRKCCLMRSHRKTQRRCAPAARPSPWRRPRRRRCSWRKLSSSRAQRGVEGFLRKGNREGIERLKKVINPLSVHW